MRPRLLDRIVVGGLVGLVWKVGDTFPWPIELSIARVDDEKNPLTSFSTAEVSMLDEIVARFGDWMVQQHPLQERGMELAISEQSSESEVQSKIESLSQELQLGEAGESAQKWWKQFVDENSARPHLVLRLLQELFVRHATLEEFFLSYVYSNTDNIQANLHYLDYRREYLLTHEDLSDQEFQNRTELFSELCSGLLRQLGEANATEEARGWSRLLIDTHAPSDISLMLKYFIRQGMSLDDVFLLSIYANTSNLYAMASYSEYSTLRQKEIKKAALNSSVQEKRQQLLDHAITTRRMSIATGAQEVESFSDRLAAALNLLRNLPTVSGAQEASGREELGVNVRELEQIAGDWERALNHFCAELRISLLDPVLDDLAQRFDAAFWNSGMNAIEKIATIVSRGLAHHVSTAEAAILLLAKACQSNPSCLNKSAREMMSKWLREHV